MKGSLRIGRVGRIPISLHWSFSLLLVFVALATLGQPLSAMGWLLVWVVAVFASVTFHELSHCLVATRRGLQVEGIVLLPIGGMSQISGLPAEPAVERDVAAAGPLSSIVLAGLLAWAAYLTGARLWPPTLFAGPWLARLTWLNVVLAGFNLLPALPMDGGRLLRAFLSERRDPNAATEAAAVLAEGVAVAMIVFGIFVNLWLVFIGVFVLFGAMGERQLGRVQRVFGGLRVSDVMAPDNTSVPSEVPVAEVGRWLAMYPGRAVPVVEAGSVVGIVSMVDLMGQAATDPVGSVCDRRAPVLDPATRLFPDAMEALARFTRGEFAVAQAGRPVGVLYRATLRSLSERQLPARAASMDGAASS
jgi:Zn-dependent protease